jgi:antibiotic biosynthesis monooxygenase (ABM) superfamily enzyme
MEGKLMNKGNKPKTSKPIPENSRQRSVTAVIRHHVKPGAEPAYEDWAKRISDASRSFPGRLNLNIIKPVGADRTYTLTIHFADSASLNKWFGSKVRNKLIKEAEGLFVHPEDVEIKTGLEFWFQPPRSAPGPAKPWKQILVTFSAFYPTTICVQKILSPLTEKPVWNNIFIRNLSGIITLTILTLIIMPRYTRLISKWLYK